MGCAFEKPAQTLQTLYIHCWTARIIIMDGVANNRYAVLTHVLKNDGTKTDEFLEWRCKLCVSLSIYNEAIYILQEQERPWETDDDHGTARGSWDAAKLDLFSVLSFSTGGSAFFIARRFEDTTPEDEARYGPLAWATLRETFKGISHEAVRAEHAKINNTRICSCLLYTSPSPRDKRQSRMPSSA